MAELYCCFNAYCLKKTQKAILGFRKRVILSKMESFEGYSSAVDLKYQFDDWPIMGGKNIKQTKGKTKK